MTAFDKMATVTASTKRSPAMVDEKRGPKVVYLTSVPCTPIDPLDPSIRMSLPLDVPVESLQTFVHDTYDILEGDNLIANSVTYRVVSVGEYDWKGTIYRAIVLLELKTE